MKALPHLEDCIIDALNEGIEELGIRISEKKLDALIDIVFAKLGFPKDPSYHNDNDRRRDVRCLKNSTQL